MRVYHTKKIFVFNNPINTPIMRKTADVLVESNKIKLKIDIIKCFIKVSTIANLSGVASLSEINIFKLIEREFPHNNAINIFNLKPPSLLMVYCIEKDAKY